MLRVMQYNMLNNALAFGAIPWVMIVPAELRLKVANYEAVLKRLRDEYIKHWHRNLNTGQYKAFRRTWGEHVQNNFDFAALGVKATYVAEDEVEYLDAKTGQSTRCTTMRGILRQVVQSSDGNHLDLANSVFEHICTSNREVFDWKVRGKNIFDLMTNRSGVAASKENTERFFEPVGMDEGVSPDLIVVCEYDVHCEDDSCPNLDYLGDGTLRTLPEAMRAAGYHAVLLEGPKHDDAGIAVFARADKLNIASAEIGDDPQALKFECGGEESIAAISVDLMEEYHPRKEVGETAIMDMQDRKNVGMCAFELVSTADSANGTALPQRLVVIGAHLMTTSRDNAKMSCYPGEVRAFEIAKIRELAASFVQPTDAVIFTGDFNINIRGSAEVNVLAGTLPLEPGSTPAEDLAPLASSLQLDTGLVNDAGEMRFCWKRIDGSPLILRDCHSVLNAQESDADGKVLGTSHNAARVETIDYVWYDEQHFTVEKASPLIAPWPNGTPDAHNPSDHIPILASLKWKPPATFQRLR